MPATIELAAVTVDCADPGPMADFYAAVADGEVLHKDADSAWVRFAATTWVFRQVEAYQPPSWPSAAVPMQIHLEFDVDDLDEAETRLIALGATPAPHQPNREGGLLVMLDPAGHPFYIGTRA